MEHQTKEPRDLTWGTNDLLWIHNAKIWLSVKDSNIQNGGRKKKKRITSSNLDRLTYTKVHCWQPWKTRVGIDLMKKIYLWGHYESEMTWWHINNQSTLLIILPKSISIEFISAVKKRGKEIVAFVLLIKKITESMFLIFFKPLSSAWDICLASLQTWKRTEISLPFLGSSLQLMNKELCFHLLTFSSSIPKHRANPSAIFFIPTWSEGLIAMYWKDHTYTQSMKQKEWILVDEKNILLNEQNREAN